MEWALPFRDTPTKNSRKPENYLNYPRARYEHLANSGSLSLSWAGSGHVEYFWRRTTHIDKASKEFSNSSHCRPAAIHIQQNDILRRLTAKQDDAWSLSKNSHNGNWHYYTFTSPEVERNFAQTSPGAIWGVVMNLTSVFEISTDYGRLRQVWYDDYGHRHRFGLNFVNWGCLGCWSWIWNLTEWADNVTAQRACDPAVIAS